MSSAEIVLPNPYQLPTALRITTGRYNGSTIRPGPTIPSGVLIVGTLLCVFGKLSEAKLRTCHEGTTGKVGTTICKGRFRSAMSDAYVAIPLFSNPKTRRKLICPGLASYSVVADEDLPVLEVITAEERREALDAFDRLNKPRKKDRQLGGFRQKKKVVDQLVLPFK